eukprot:8710969-Pyramimonas_sp.AAC.2
MAPLATLHRRMKDPTTVQQSRHLLTQADSSARRESPRPSTPKRVPKALPRLSNEPALTRPPPTLTNTQP